MLKPIKVTQKNRSEYKTKLIKKMTILILLKSFTYEHWTTVNSDIHLDWKLLVTTHAQNEHMTLFHFCLNPLFQDNSDTNMLKAAEVS